MANYTIRQLNNMLLNPRGKQIDVRDVFTLNDGTLWYDIPGFPSYQLSNTDHIRSFKCKHQYPFGAIKRYRSTCNGIMYMLSDKNNINRNIDLDQIKRLVNSNPEKIGYTTYGQNSIQRARNSRAFIDFETVDDTVITDDINRMPVRIRKEKCGIPKFTTIPDPEEDLEYNINDLLGEPYKEIIKPIRFIEGGF